MERLQTADLLRAYRGEYIHSLTSLFEQVSALPVLALDRESFAEAKIAQFATTLPSYGDYPLTALDMVYLTGRMVRLVQGDWIREGDVYSQVMNDCHKLAEVIIVNYLLWGMSDQRTHEAVRNYFISEEGSLTQLKKQGRLEGFGERLTSVLEQSNRILDLEGDNISVEEDKLIASVKEETADSFRGAIGLIGITWYHI